MLPLASLSPKGLSTDPNDDPLQKGPPLPSMTSAKPGSSSGSGSDDDSGPDLSALGALAGSRTVATMSGLMSIEKIINQLAKSSPAAAQILATALDQAKNVAAAELGGGAQGAMQMQPQDAGAPPLGLSPGGPGGPGGMPPMPPPPMMGQ